MRRLPLGCEDARDLSRKARKAISEEDCLLSLASVWEVAIKISVGKLKLPSSIERYVPQQRALYGFSSFEIGFRHIARCSELPWHHRDP